MEYLFVCYPGCSTCKRARQWLEERGAAFWERDIKAQNPTAPELEAWIEKSGKEPRGFFNTSGMRYRELNVKERLPGMTRSEQIALLATDGMLVKRPLLIAGDVVLAGFSPEGWEAALGTGTQ